MRASTTRRTGALDRAGLGALRAAVLEVEAWPPGSHRWGHYAEQTAAGPVPCRTENVSACHPRVAGLVAGALAWAPAELAPGDAVLIDGLATHSSEANRSAAPRRVLVASYAPARDGYARERYYAARQATMTDASARDGRFRISTLADFEGVEVRPDAPATEACTHPAAATA